MTSERASTFEAAVVAQPHASDRGLESFTEATEPLQRELRVYCYRMTGSFVESEDLLQETLLRAWRGWSGFRGMSSVRTWLYRIATNVCLDHLDRQARRVLPFDVTGAASGATGLPEPTDGPWLEPIPNAFLGDGDERDPAGQVAGSETLELAFLAAVQLLPARQRAAWILRDVLGMSAKEAAGLVDISVAALKSALQRARAALRRALPAQRLDWSQPPATEEDRALVRRYVAALHERDAPAMGELLHDDLRVAYPPREFWVSGRDVFLDGSTDHAPAGEFRYVETGANGQPAVAVYLRPPGSSRFRRLSLAVVRIAEGRIIEIVDFSDRTVLDAFGLEPTLSGT